MDLFSATPDVPPFAQKRSRVFAAFIDFILLMAGCYLIAYVTGQTINEDGKIGFHLTGGPALVAMLYGALLLPVLEGLTGQTIGKRVLGIKVLRNDYSKSGIGSSIVRHLFDIVDCFLLIGLIVAATNPNKQRVGDLVAKTYVVVKA